MMELCSLYNRLGKLIDQRGTLEQDIRSVESGSNNTVRLQTNGIRSLKVQYEQVQQQILEVEDQIRIREEG
ncbi:MAG: hypothetical protein P9M15_01600 [Candidatus Electryoneaceae bacterium]|nr:hypothetical protein [Candidatus Electryoneaceae bacterium]